MDATSSPEFSSPSPSPSQSPRTKPRLRGVSHEIAFYLSLGAGVMLAAVAPGAHARVAMLIYSASLAALYGISALYHRPQWEPAKRQWMRRLDHAAIFVLIAGSYTPLCMLVPTSQGGSALLGMVWLGALVGVLKSLFWVHAPKPISAAVYVLYGWLVFAQLRAISGGLGELGIGLLVASGVIYSCGALIYALRRPDPIPAVFGYHEVFHALVIVASGCHFALVLRVLRMYAA